MADGAERSKKARAKSEDFLARRKSGDLTEQEQRLFGNPNQDIGTEFQNFFTAMGEDLGLVDAPAQTRGDGTQRIGDVNRRQLSLPTPQQQFAPPPAPVKPQVPVTGDIDAQEVRLPTSIDNSLAPETVPPTQGSMDDIILQELGIVPDMGNDVQTATPTGQSPDSAGLLIQLLMKGIGKHVLGLGGQAPTASTFNDPFGLAGPTPTQPTQGNVSDATGSSSIRYP